MIPNTKYQKNRIHFAKRDKETPKSLQEMLRPAVRTENRVWEERLPVGAGGLAQQRPGPPPCAPACGCPARERKAPQISLPLLGDVASTDPGNVNPAPH